MTTPQLRPNRVYPIDIVIPVLNEAHVLEKSVETVRRFMHERFADQSRVVIVDNGSTDGTDKLAKELSQRYEDVSFVHLIQRGRGRALRSAWMQSQASVVCYMDVDLSTELEALPVMVNAILSKEYDIAVGSRLMRGAKVKRSFKREFISHVYNIFVKAVLFTRFSDAQCGFKSVSRKVVDQIVPQIEDQSWFFDTELLVLAEKQGYRIKDIPVVWNEDDDSRVKILRTAWDDIKGVFRLRMQLWNGKFAPAPIVEAKREEP